MGFDNPTPQTEDLYIKSINTTVDRYRALLAEVSTGTLVLPNCDLDDGKVTQAAEYSLADQSYADLLAKLSANKFDLTSAGLRGNILDFYADLTLPITTRKDPARWQIVLTDLDQLRAATRARPRSRRSNRGYNPPLHNHFSPAAPVNEAGRSSHKC